MRTDNGKRMMHFSAIRPERKAERFDPVVEKWSDPDTISDKRLKKMLCDAGGLKGCAKCRLCAYGRELLKRAEKGMRL